MKLTIRETPGRCRWCDCTDDNGCAEGCSWVNPAHTLCSACGDLDRLVRTRGGRAQLATALQEFDREALLAPVPPRRRR
jgi:hypothetical protein